jgi:hypothetical protein
MPLLSGLKDFRLKQKIAITALSSLSSLGHDQKTIWEHYLDGKSMISLEAIGNKKIPVARIPDETKKKVEDLRML